MPNTTTHIDSSDTKADVRPEAVTRPRRFGLVVTTALLGTLLFGCQDKDTRRASTSAPAVENAAAVVGSTAQETLRVDAAASRITFTGRKITGRHEGSFSRFSGAVELVAGKAEGSSVSIEIEMDSVTVEPPKLLGHLKSPDFFDVARFPKAKFVSTAIKAGAPGSPQQVTGNLTLHGVTKTISFPATITVAATGVEASAEFSINRKDFGVVYPGMPDDLIQDDVPLKLTLKAPRAH